MPRVLFAVGSLFAVIVATMHAAPAWSMWRPASCMPDRCFCEAVASGWIRQPANTLSSLLFCLAGSLVLLTNPLDRGPRYSSDKYLFWASMMFIGLGSAFFHASLSFWGQTSDVLGMYLLATLLLLWSARSSTRLSPAQEIATFVAGNVVLLSALVFVPAVRRYVFAALILALILLEIRRKRELSHRSMRVFGSALAIMTFGFVIWIADLTKVACAPSSWLQGHAIWHASGAAAATLMFVYFHPPRRVVDDVGAVRL